MGLNEPDKNSVAKFGRYALLILLLTLLSLLFVNHNKRERYSSSGKIRQELDANVAPDGSPSAPVDNNKITYRELIRWIQHDNPVDDEKSDIFGHRHIAFRIIDRVVRGKSDSQDMSQAIVGRFGSGKSTVLALAKHHLQKRANLGLKIIDIPMWPYSTSRAAAIGVIESLIKALSEEVNTLSLRGVPAAYAEAISSAPGGRIALAALRPSIEHPANVLKSVDEVARVIGVHYVVWIEDLERFSLGTEGEEKLEVVRSLLHSLHKLPSFTVVTATTDLSHRVDMDKIARFVERIPDLPTETVQHICSLFMQEWRNLAVRSDCVEVAIQSPWYSTAEDYRYRKALLSEGVYCVSPGIASLLTAPRLLKRVLRQCQESWRQLLGEVDLAQLFGICLIRECQPRVFSVVDKNVDILRGFQEDQFKKVDGSPLANVWGEFKEAMDGLSEVESDAIESLLKEIFIKRATPISLQGFGVNVNHVDYWNRFSSQLDIPRTARDQYVIKALRGDDMNTALDVLNDKRYGAGAAVHLARLIPAERLVACLVPLTHRYVKESANRRGAAAGGLGTHSGFGVLASALRGHPDREDVSSNLVQAVSDAIDCCISEYAFDCLYSLELLVFSEARPHQSSLLLKQNRVLLRKRMLDKLVMGLIDVRRIAEGLKVSNDNVLLYVFWGSEWVEDKSYLDPQKQPFTEWSKVADVLLRALEADPDALAGPISFMVFSPPGQQGSKWRFDASLCLARFGENSRVVQAIARSSPRTDQMREVHASLQEWLKHESSNGQGTEDGRIRRSDFELLDNPTERDGNNNDSAAVEIEKTGSDLHHANAIEKSESISLVKGVTSEADISEKQTSGGGNVSDGQSPERNASSEG